MKKYSEIDLATVASLLLVMLLPLGMAGYLKSTLYILIFLLHAGLLVFAASLSVKKIFSEFQQSSLTLKLLAISAFIISLLFCLPNLILPVTARDALIHHLAIPKLWIQSAAIYETSWHEWSYYPMLIQLGFSAILQFLPEQFCALYIFLFFPLFISAVAALVRSISEPAAPLSVIISASLPIILKLSSSPLVDLPLAFFCAAGLYYMFKGAAGLFATSFGLALGTKLNAIPFVLFSSLSFLAINLAPQSNIKNRFLQLIKISVIALIIFSPWLIKNYIWTSNPLYPYAQSIFGSSETRIDSGLRGLNPLQQRVLLYNESMLDVVLLPVRIFFEGQDDNPRYFDGVFSPLLFIGLIYAAFNLKDKKIRLLFLIFFAYLFFSLFSTGARIRYLAPVYPVIIALTSLAFLRLSAFSKLAAYSGLLTHLLCSVFYVTNNGSLEKSYQYLVSEISRQSYLEGKIAEFPLIEYCNQNLPADSKIYLIYTGNQFYLYDRQTFSSGHTSADHLLYWIKSSPDGNSLAEKLKEQNITHLLFNQQRLYQVLSASLDAGQKTVWNDFYGNHLKPLHEGRGFSLSAVQ